MFPQNAQPRQMSQPESSAERMSLSARWSTIWRDACSTSHAWKGPGMKRVSTACGLLVAVMMLAVPALAQDGTQPSRTGEALQAYESLTDSQRVQLDKLDDPDEAVRDEVLTQLLAAPPNDALLGRFYVASVSPEQRARLRQVAIHHEGVKLMQPLLTPEDGAILGMSPIPQRVWLPGKDADQADSNSEGFLGLAVRWTFPGSPAFAWLRQGDVITQVDHRPLGAVAGEGDLVTGFIRAIAQKKAGERLSLQVVRHGRVMDLTLALGSEAALRSLYIMGAGGPPRAYAPAYAAAIRKRLGALEVLKPSPKPWVIEAVEPRVTEE